jgi:hypothetical protein
MIANESDFDILLDAENELAFALQVEGAAGSKVKSRFIIEAHNGIKLALDARVANDEVVVDVPVLKGMLSEGNYNTSLEVTVDDRLFVPLELVANLRQEVKVEAAIRGRVSQGKPVVKATIVSRKKPVAQKAVMASPVATEPELLPEAIQEQETRTLVESPAIEPVIEPAVEPAAVAGHSSSSSEELFERASEKISKRAPRKLERAKSEIDSVVEEIVLTAKRDSTRKLTEADIRRIIRSRLMKSKNSKS